MLCGGEQEGDGSGGSKGGGCGGAALACQGSAGGVPVKDSGVTGEE